MSFCTRLSSLQFTSIRRNYSQSTGQITAFLYRTEKKGHRIFIPSADIYVWRWNFNRKVKVMDQVCAATKINTKFIQRNRLPITVDSHLVNEIRDLKFRQNELQRELRATSRKLRTACDNLWNK